MTDSPLPKPALAAALHAIEITRTGVIALEEAALHGPLGEAIDKAIGIVAESKGRLIVTGIGKSGHIARKLAATFSSTGTPAYYVHPTEAGHGDLGMVDGTDVIMALSWSGETTELAVVLAFAKRFNVPVIALTAGAESTLAAAADVALILPRVREACPHRSRADHIDGAAACHRRRHRHGRHGAKGFLGKATSTSSTPAANSARSSGACPRSCTPNGFR